MRNVIVGLILMLLITSLIGISTGKLENQVLEKTQIITLIKGDSLTSARWDGENLWYTTKQRCTDITIRTTYFNQPNKTKIIFKEE